MRPKSSPVSPKYIYVHKLLIKHSLLIWYFHLLQSELIFVSFVCSILFLFNHCIFVFVVLCFVFCALLVTLSLLLVITGGQHDGLLLSGSLPVLYIYIHINIFLMANKLCCSAVLL